MADLKESYLFRSLREQSDHWYYSTKIYFLRRLLHRYLPVTADPLQYSDWGAGNGIIGISLFETLIQSKEPELELIDTGYSTEALSGSPKRTRYIRCPDPSKKYHILTAIDVIEHINDDSEFISLLVSHMDSDSVLILAAPALDILWSNHDIYLEHYRRYNLQCLESICSSSGLQILESGYLFSIVLPAILAVRLFRRTFTKNKIASDMSILPSAINNFLKLALKLECFCKLHLKLTANVPGSTVFLVAKKYE